jgi:hypothetical protein
VLHDRDVRGNQLNWAAIIVDTELRPQAALPCGLTRRHRAMAGSVRYGATVSARDGMSAMDRVPVTETWYNLRKLKKSSCMGSEKNTCGVLRRMRKRQRIRFPDSRQGDVVSGNQRREIASDKTDLRVRSSRPSWKT